MQNRSDDTAATYLTTKEVAALLRVKERKVYDLAAAGEIPHRRITGKLLFPKADINAWIEGRERSEGKPRPPVLAGSHDPLLDWAVRESGCGLATLINGSLAGLDAFLSGEAALTGLHLPDATGWNEDTVAASGVRDSVLLAWARRMRGLLLHTERAGEITEIADLKGRRIALRQPGAGGAALLDRLLADAGLSRQDVRAADEVARTESDAAAAVAAGEADAALAIAAVAKPFHLTFVPLIEERYDLLVDRRAYFTPPVQRLFAFARSDALARKAASLGGYDTAELGSVRWLSP